MSIHIEENWNRLNTLNVALEGLKNILIDRDILLYELYKTRSGRDDKEEFKERFKKD